MESGVKSVFRYRLSQRPDDDDGTEHYVAIVVGSE